MLSSPLALEHWLIVRQLDEDAHARSKRPKQLQREDSVESLGVWSCFNLPQLTKTRHDHVHGCSGRGCSCQA